MMDRADLLKRIGDLTIAWHPTERERIEIAGMLRERNATLDMPASDAVATLVSDLRKGQHWQIRNGAATVETAIEVSKVCQEAADLLERLDRLSAALVRPCRSRQAIRDDIMTDEPTIVLAPPNTLRRIEEVWLFVSSDENGEGVAAAPMMGPGSLVPLIAADEQRLKSLIPIARYLAREAGMKIKLIKLTARTEIMQIEPDGGRTQ